MISNRAFVLFLVTFAILSGCIRPLNPGDRVNQGVSGAAPTLTGANDFQFLDCRTTSIGVHPPLSQVQAMLPDGFNAVGLVPGTADVNLEVHRCESAILGNETVLAPFGWMSVVTFVRAPDGVQAGGVPNVFVLQIAATSPSILQWFSSWGLPAVEAAEISIDDGLLGQEAIHVQAGNCKYDGAGYLGEGGQGAAQPLTRKHHFESGSNLGAFWYNSTTRTLGGQPRAYDMQVDGCVLAALSPGQAGRHAALASASRDSGILTFE